MHHSENTEIKLITMIKQRRAFLANPKNTGKEPSVHDPRSQLKLSGGTPIKEPNERAEKRKTTNVDIRGGKQSDQLPLPRVR